MADIFEGDDSPGKGKRGCGDGSEYVQPGEKDTQVQLVISLALGLTAFFTFCVCPFLWLRLKAETQC